VLTLPSGRVVRGRGLRRPRTAASPAAEGPDAGPDPEFGLYLLGRRPPVVPWTARWLRWPDFWLPLDRSDALEAIGEAWVRAEQARVEVACGGGRGRTGTVLACMAVLDGMEPRRAIAFVRARYDPHAVETPWQRRYVERFPQSLRAHRESGRASQDPPRRRRTHE
jgi:hypothetical protein